MTITQLFSSTKYLYKQEGNYFQLFSSIKYLYKQEGNNFKTPPEGAAQGWSLEIISWWYGQIWHLLYAQNGYIIMGVKRMYQDYTWGHSPWLESWNYFLMVWESMKFSLCSEWLYYGYIIIGVKRTFYTQNKNIIKFVYFPSKTNLAILHQLQLIIITHTSLRYRKYPLVYFLPA